MGKKIIKYCDSVICHLCYFEIYTSRSNNTLSILFYFNKKGTSSKLIIISVLIACIFYSINHKIQKKLRVKDNFDQKKYIFSYNFRYLSSFLQVFIFIFTKMIKKKLKDYLCHHDRYCLFKSASISCFLR